MYSYKLYPSAALVVVALALALAGGGRGALFAVLGPRAEGAFRRALLELRGVEARRRALLVLLVLAVAVGRRVLRRRRLARRWRRAHRERHTRPRAATHRRARCRARAHRARRRQLDRLGRRYYRTHLEQLVSDENSNSEK